jgi:hypothetical protein
MIKRYVAMCKCGHAPHGNESCQTEQCQCSATRQDDYLHARLRDAADTGRENLDSDGTLIRLMELVSQRD